MPHPLRNNPKTMHKAGELRTPALAGGAREELTPAEAKLWAYLRGNKLNGVNFRRQHAVGNYIPDFVSIKRKLVIELDGTPFGRNIWSMKVTTRNEPNTWKRWDIKLSAFGITRS